MLSVYAKKFYGYTTSFRILRKLPLRLPTKKFCSPSKTYTYIHIYIHKKGFELYSLVINLAIDDANIYEKCHENIKK